MSESRAESVLLGRYTLLSRLASGGMGAVHLARVRGERGFTRPVAVKLLHAHLAEDPDIVTRFVEEARVAACVKHPHVVSVLDVGETAGAPFLVLDYVHGESFEGLLRAARKRREPVPLDVIAGIGSDLLEGLAAAHGAKDAHGAPLDVVHRDVSPHNVLVSEHGIAYVTDFGIAKVRDRLRLTGTNDMLGKAGYMAPEQLGAPGGITPATDLYGAGIVLWEAITGRKLFDGLEQQMLAMVERAEAPRSSEHRPDVPPALDALVSSMLANDPSARPASAIACHAALADALPRASAARIAAWMRGYAGERLTQLEGLLRAAPAEIAPTPEIAVEVTLTADPPVPSPMPRRKTAVVAVVGLALAVLVGVSVAFARPHAADPAPIAVLPSEPRVAAPSVTPNEPAAPAETPTAAVVPSGRPVTRGGSRARAAAPNAACNPPYVLVDNIKHYKRECFAGSGQ